MQANITTLPVLPNTSLFSQQGVNYGLKSYLSVSNQYATIDRSVTFDHRSYHLVSVHNPSSQSYLLTAIKIASYFTFILPVLALIIVSITDGKNHYYDSKYYIHEFRYMLCKKPETAKIITLLDPLVLYKERQFGKSTLNEIFRYGNPQERKSIIQFIKNNPGSALTKEDKKTLLFSWAEDNNKQTVEIIKALNIATQGALHQDLTKDDLNKILNRNSELWTYLTSKTNPFPVNPRSIEVDLDYFYIKLRYPIRYKNELADLYKADPSVLTRADSNGRTIFMTFLENHTPGYPLKEPVDWIIKTDLNSILTKNNTAAIFNEISKPYISSELKYALKTLNTATKGAIHKDLTQNCVDKIYRYNRDLWDYLTNADGTNPYPIDPTLHTPPTSSSRGPGAGFSGSHSSSSSSSSGRSSGPRRSPPPRASSSEPTYTDYLNTLYGLSGTTKDTHPITSKRSIKKIYIGAAAKLHPDKNNNTPESTEKMKLFNSAYTNIQKTRDYEDLLD